MCGISGFWLGKRLENNSSEILKNMLKTLYHRGPDGDGEYIDKEKGLAMGHTRLSIIDLKTGDQPLFDHTKSIVLTTNGEFYDFKRIRADLMSKGDRFTTKSDSEIAINLYKRHSLSFVDYLRGEFAFALYDYKNEQLILVRDRFGIKPLFFYCKDGTFVYGSEVKSLLEHPLVPKELDKRASIHQLMQVMVPGTSAFKDIHALQPGHMLIVKKEGDRFNITSKCYWDMDFPEKDGYKKQNDEYYIEAVREKLIEAVHLRLEADVPVGCYLSGGIDSCSILGLATGAQQSPVKAFTISFDHKDYDESQIAIGMAEEMNADQEILNITASELYGDNYIKAIWHSERTFYNTLGVAKWCMSRRVHECGYKVVVTGEGSDELFGGYPFFKRDMILHGLDEENKSFYDDLYSSNQIFKGVLLTDNVLSHPSFESLCGFTPSWVQNWMGTLELAKNILSEEVSEELKSYDPIETIALAIEPNMVKNRHPLDIVQYTWAKTMLEGQILNWGGDRVDMANSMESRPAFLDHHLANLATQIPPTVRIKNNIEKWVLREAMKGILPDILYKRQKFAFMAPPGHTEPEKQKALNRLIENYLSPDSIKKAGILDAKKVETFLKEYKSETDNTILVRQDALLNHMIGLHIMHDLFIK